MAAFQTLLGLGSQQQTKTYNIKSWPIPELSLGDSSGGLYSN
jgi:hypothetical protein